ncbi:GATA-type domain-containing protein [[Candida] zeylanoides]
MYDSDHFRPGHARSRSYSELISQFRTAILSSSPAAKMSTRTSITSATYVKKRSHSDLARDTQSLVPDRSHKRSRTAPPLPPYDFPRSLVTVKAAVTPQPKPQQHVSEPKSVFPSSQKPSSPTPQSPSSVRTLVDSARHTPVKLPSLSSALNSTPMNTIKLNPITPTVSLDYFDTYKPNDENWRFELLDSISKTSKPDYKTTSSLSRFQQNVARARPSFNSKISSKIIHTTESLPQPSMTATPKSSYSEKRINFPYESNYTYLNRTYLNDVERYPEYLELAKSLISLSQSKSTSSPSMAREPAEVDNNATMAISLIIINRSSGSRIHSRTSIQGRPFDPPIAFQADTVNPTFFEIEVICGFSFRINEFSTSISAAAKHKSVYFMWLGSVSLSAAFVVYKRGTVVQFLWTQVQKDRSQVLKQTS